MLHSPSADSDTASLNDGGQVFVTRPSMPDLNDFIPYLEEIWKTGILTNGGPLHQRLETELAEFLDVPHISLFTNGTIALLVALKALGRQGEVVTTPFSFVATTQAITWAGLRPVFADIAPDTLNLNPVAVNAAIGPDTAAILPVHCYGVPADVGAFAAISERLRLPIVYDAAHAFGVTAGGNSVLTHGDMSVLSFHATKVFSTFEGGAIVSRSPEAKREIDRLRNFNFIDETTIGGEGINGKMSEIHAAFGLLQLKHVRGHIQRRLQIARLYENRLAGLRGVARHPIMPGNGGYYPIQVTTHSRVDRDGLYAALRRRGIFARRYFFPLISNIPRYAGLPSANPANLPVANATAARVLCLPIYPDLKDETIEAIVALIADICE